MSSAPWRGVLLRAILGSAAVLIALTLALWARPPDLLRVGAAYAAKTVCSNVFLANRDPAEVLETDVKAPGHPILRFMRITVDRRLGLVHAGLFGFIGGGFALSRPGLGCTVMRSSDKGSSSPTATHEPLPPRSSEDLARADAPALQHIVDDEGLAGPGMRAIVVLKDGRLAAERYARGFGAAMPQLGWSMTKTVTAALIGTLVQDGRLRLGQAALPGAGGGRERITVADLMSMSSGLAFDEGYADVSDVTRMLYLEPDMAAYARAKPLVHPVDTTWSYSSGTAVILSRLFQDTVDGDPEAFIHARLFSPLGMTSAVLEADATGTLVGSSYLYATPRDWARFGQLLAQDGIWQGREILPRGYVEMMSSPAPASGGEYGRGMVWRWVTAAGKPENNSGGGPGIPADAFWLSGHDGQYVAVIASRHLVIVRMGLTPARYDYHPEPLVRAILDAAA